MAVEIEGDDAAHVYPDPVTGTPSELEQLAGQCAALLQLIRELVEQCETPKR
jgi:hypothetical protein